MDRVTQNTKDKPVKNGHAAKKLLLICLKKIFIGEDYLTTFSYYSSSSG